jgi:hypothetical protein
MINLSTFLRTEALEEIMDENVKKRPLQEFSYNHKGRPTLKKKTSQTSMDSQVTGMTGLTGMTGVTGIMDMVKQAKKKNKTDVKFLADVDETTEEDMDY